MKNYLLFLSIYFISSTIIGQETITTSITHNSLQRDYILYVPASYNGEKAVPLVFNFHGYTSNASEQMWYGDFRSIADTANFLLVHPEGTLLNGQTHWNVGGFTQGSTVDDVGFTAALIDSLSGMYNINQEKIYATGMSNGGYFSYLLACQLSERIAAIASVTGSMTPETYNNCDPQHPIPVMQIHGTSDPTVPFMGNFISKPIDEVIEYWVDFNNCEIPANLTAIPDINTDDASTVDYFVYENGDAGATTELFKIYGGEHTWPGSIFVIGVTNKDINASKEIWNFFSRYDINGKIQTTTATDELAEQNLVYNLYPNPASSCISINGKGLNQSPYKIYSSLGNIVKEGRFLSDENKLDVYNLSPNIYYLLIGDQNVRFVVN